RIWTKRKRGCGVCCGIFGLLRCRRRLIKCASPHLVACPASFGLCAESRVKTTHRSSHEDLVLGLSGRWHLLVPALPVADLYDSFGAVICGDEAIRCSKSSAWYAYHRLPKRGSWDSREDRECPLV